MQKLEDITIQLKIYSTYEQDCSINDSTIMIIIILRVMTYAGHLKTNDICQTLEKQWLGF